MADTIATRLSAVKFRNDWTFTQISEWTMGDGGESIDPGQLSRYFSGASEPMASTLARICRAMRVSSDEILGLKVP